MMSEKLSIYLVSKFAGTTSETITASLNAYKNLEIKSFGPGHWSHREFNYICSGYSGEEFIPFSYVLLYGLVERCFLITKQIVNLGGWDGFYLPIIHRRILRERRECSRYPYQESITGEWCTQEFSQSGDSASEQTESKTVNILNMQRKPKKGQPYPLLNDRTFPSALKEDGFVVLFHGTGHDAAVSIIEEGINLKKGRQKTDFGKGFYLNDDYNESVNFAFRNPEQQAVIVFRIPQCEFDRFRESSINLQGAAKKSQWWEITNLCRFGNPRKVGKELKSVSYIEGPMASFSNGKIHGQIAGSYQMCLHSKELAEVFNRHLHSVVFF